MKIPLHVLLGYPKQYSMYSGCCSQLIGETPWIFAAADFAAMTRDIEDCLHCGRRLENSAVVVVAVDV